MPTEISGDYYDYKQTMQPERPWLVDWHQRFVYRHSNAQRGGTGMYSGDPEMAAARPSNCRWLFGDGKIARVCMPALWCDAPTLIAFSKGGFNNRYWPVPPEWSDVSEVQLSTLTVDGPQPRNRVPVDPDGIQFSLLAGEAVCITPV